MHKKMLAFDKPVKIYFDTKYIKTIPYSLIDFVQEEYPNKILTWIPANFETQKDMLKFMDKHIEKELQLN